MSSHKNLAYGERGAGRDIAPFSTLIFTLELKGIEAAPEKESKTIDAAKLVPAKEGSCSEGKEECKKVDKSSEILFSCLKIKTKCAQVAHFFMSFCCLFHNYSLLLLIIN